MEQEFLPDLFLRTPFYSFARYDLARLPEVLGYVTFRNALLLASPVLYAELEKKEFDFNRLDGRERHTLAKYYNRMCFRPTPFGGFAAFTMLQWQQQQAPVRLAPEADCKYLLLPDNASRQLKRGAALVKNPTLYRLGRSWRYYRSAVNERGHHDFTIDGLDAVRFNNELLRRCASPALRDDLAAWITHTTGCPAGEAEDYLDFLETDQVIFSAGRGSLIARETARPVACTAALSKALYYAAVERPLVSGGPETTDQEELSRALLALHKLTGPAAVPALAKFISDFSARFDQQKVPLLLALDPDTGLNYGRSVTTGASGTDLLADLRFPAVSPGPQELEWTCLRRLLFRLWTGNSRRGFYEPVIIGPGDLEEPADAGPPVTSMPNTFAVLFRRADDLLLLEHAGGGSATQMLGRFTVFNQKVQALCLELAKRESAANPGVVFADIGQRSNEHYDNINRRNPIYPYEIPLNVYSELPGKQQLNPDDLYLSVRGDKLMLESRKLGKRVIPRLATAYNHRHTYSGVFNLLCEMQYQEVSSSLLFDPELLFPNQDFYPRVVYGRTILSLAKWRFSVTELATLNSDNLSAFCSKYRLPRRVSLGTGDRQLVFDFFDREERAFFLHCISGLGEVIVQEYLSPGREIKAGNKSFVGQYIAVFAHQRMVYQPVVSESALTGGVKRQFIPGSDWLYLKLYCTPSAADRLLAEVVGPVVGKFSHRLQGWFFIRYTDPDYHLRLRFCLNGRDSGSLLAALKKRLEQSGLEQTVRGLLADTYLRELERYGLQAMEQAEKVFEAGSDLVLAQLQVVDGPSEFSRGYRIAGEMICCFFPEIPDRLSFVQKLSESLLQQFKADKSLRLDLGRKFRGLKNELSESPLPGTARLIFEMEKIKTAAANKSGTARRALLADLVHMQLNRVFTTDQRRYEMLVYYCLHKFLAGQIAREKRSGPFTDQ